MIPKNKKRITITLPEITYQQLEICRKIGNTSRSKYIELSLNSTLNWEAKEIDKEIKRRKHDKSKK